MGWVGQVLNFVRTVRGTAKVSDTTLDRGGGENRTAEHFADAGDDSYPRPEDYVATITQAGTGRDTAVGYLDPKNGSIAAVGEKRIYSRASDGIMIAEVHLLNDGTIRLENAVCQVILLPDGSVQATNPIASFDMNADGLIRGQNSNGLFELQPAGPFFVNGVTIGTDGSISTGSVMVTTGSVTSPSVVAGGKELTEHIHLAGTPPGDTGVNK